MDVSYPVYSFIPIEDVIVNCWLDSVCHTISTESFAEAIYILRESSKIAKREGFMENYIIRRFQLI